MKRLFAGKQALTPVATESREAPLQEYGNISPRSGSRYDVDQGRYQNSQPSPRMSWSRGSKEIPLTQPAPSTMGQGARAYPSYGDQQGQDQPQAWSGQQAYRPDRGFHDAGPGMQRQQPRPHGRHQRDASFGRGSSSQQQEIYALQDDQFANRGGHGGAPPAEAFDRFHQSYAQPHGHNAPFPYSGAGRPQQDISQHVDATESSAHLRRRTSRSQKHKSGGGVGALFHRQPERATSVVPLRRQSTTESYQNEEPVYGAGDTRGPPQRHMSLSYGRNYRQRRDEADALNTSPRLAERPESRYVDEYDDRQNADMQKPSTQDKMKRFMFGQRRGKGPKDTRSPQPMLDSDGDSSDDAAARPASRGRASAGAMLSGSWEHVPSETSHDAQTKKGASEGKSKPWATLRDKKKQSGAEKQVPDASITEQVHHLVTLDEYLWEKEMLQRLSMAVSRSEATARDAMQALRKELVLRKYDGNANAARAVKLWACLYIYSSDRFKLQTTNKKFLEALEDLYHGKHTSTSTQGRLLGAWSMIAHDASVDADLQPIVKAFNKIKPSDMPTNGTPLDRDHDIFQIGDVIDAQYDDSDANLPAVRVDAPREAQGSYDMRGHAPFARQEQQMAGVGLDPRAQDMVPNASQQSSAYSSLATSGVSSYYPAHMSGGQQRDFVSPAAAEAPRQQHQYHDPNDEMRRRAQDESAAQQQQQHLSEEERLRAAEEDRRRHAEIARLHEECNVARSNAQVLSDSLAENDLGDPLVREFGEKVRASQEYIAGQIPHLSNRVDDARRDANTVTASSNGNYDYGSALMQDEQILEDFLDAHEKLITASSMLDEAEIKKREDDEEAQVLERSMREMRMDRSTLVRDPNTGHLYDVNNLPSHLDPAALRNMSYDGSNDDAMNLRVPRSAVPYLTGNAEASGSRSPSPHKRPLPEQPIAAHTHAPGPRPMHGSLAGSNGSSRVPHPLPPRPLPNSTTASTPQQVEANGRSAAFGAVSNDAFMDDSDDIVTPVQPSEKALGKRRAVSIYEAPLMPGTVGGGSGSATPGLVDSDRSHDEHTSAQNVMLRTRPPPALPNL